MKTGYNIDGGNIFDKFFGLISFILVLITIVIVVVVWRKSIDINNKNGSINVKIT